MGKEREKVIHVIDKDVKNQMAFFDSQRSNYFDERMSLIMSFKPYTQKVKLGRPTVSPEPRIVLVRKGSSTLNIAGTDYVLERNHMLTIPANCVFAKQCQTEDYDVYNLAYSAIDPELETWIGYEPIHFKLSDVDLALFEGYFQLLALLCKSKSASLPGIDSLVQSLFCSVKTMFEKESLLKAPVKLSRAKQVMNDFLTVLMRQQYPERKPEFYAQKLHLSKGHLSDVVKANSDKTLMEWINDRVVLIAKSLLNATDDSVETIAHHLHFSDYAQFTKYFKKHSGVTPSEYRKKV